MNNAQYVKAAMATMSDKWYGDRVALVFLVEALRGASEQAAKLDSVKKAMFYGRDFEAFEKTAKHAVVDSVMPRVAAYDVTDDRERARRILHGIIGIITEAGELSDALLTAIESGTPLDLVNIIEEVGDTQWYVAAIADALDVPIDAFHTINIAKLKERYGLAFSEIDANVRSLNEERSVLNVLVGSI